MCPWRSGASSFPAEKSPVLILQAAPPFKTPVNPWAGTVVGSFRSYPITAPELCRVLRASQAYRSMITAPQATPGWSSSS